MAVESLTKVNEAQSRQLEVQSRQLETQANQLGTLTEQNAEMAQRIKELTAQIAWFQRQMFGRKSEQRLCFQGQPSLFGDDELGEQGPAEGPEESGTDDSASESKPGQRRKPSSRQHQTWENLPILETRILEPEGGVDLERYRKIGEETTYLLGFEPGKLFRIAVVRPKYGLKDSSEPVERGEGVKIAPLPLFPIYKGMHSSSLLAEILLKKYKYHMPFYRQIKEFAHLGLTGLKEPTVTGWFKRTMELLRPLYDALVEEIFVGYTYTRWDAMMRILDDGRLLFDTNLAKNEIRPITLGRKNYMFCGNHEAVEDMCVITSLLSTCRNHDVNPRLYLNSVIESMPYFLKAEHEELVRLLPHKWKEYHPEAIMDKVRNLAK